jgi:hypothetical protein
MTSSQPSSVTNVPRSLAAALSPFVAGFLLEQTSFGWPSQVRPLEGA